MSATELQFRTAAIGGFQKQDVLSYIESANQIHQNKLDQLQRELDHLTREKEELAGRAAQAEAQAKQLAEEKEDLSGQLEQARREADRLRTDLETARGEAQAAREGQTQSDARLEQLQARLDRAEADAAAYQQVKDRTAGIELEAHCRAQEVQKAAEEKVKRSRTEVEQWLHKVKAGYELLRTDMDGAISRTYQDLDKTRQLLEQLSSNFDAQDEHLRKLSQDCVADFAPAAPEPLPLNEQ